MPFREIEGHRATLSLVRSLVARGKLPHAILFAGPEGIGKRTAAFALAQLVLCPARRSEGGLPDACGECGSCRRIEKRNHMDLCLIEPTTADDDASPAGDDEPTGRDRDVRSSLRRRIKIEQIRSSNEHPNPSALQDRLRLKPAEGGRPVAIVDDAHWMLPQAANTLLKTLEEPPNDAVIVLVSSRPEQLLATVQSRCRRFDFAPLPADALARILPRALDSRGDEAPALPPLGDRPALIADSEGSVGTALRLLSGSWAEERGRTVALLSSFARGEARAALELHAHLVPKASKTKSDDDRFRTAIRLELLTACLRELLHRAASPGRAPWPGAPPVPLPAVEAAADALRASLDARASLEHFANTKLVLDVLALALRDALGPRVHAAPSGPRSR